MYIVTVIEKGGYDFPTEYTFETLEEARQFLISMRGVLLCIDFYKQVGGD